MGKKGKVKNILLKVFKDGENAATFNNDTEKVAIVTELQKHGLPFGIWDVPITENGQVKAYVKQIVVKDEQKLAEVLESLK